MLVTPTLEEHLCQVLRDFLKPYLALLGAEPAFDLSVFGIQRGFATRKVFCASRLYPSNFFKDSFIERLKAELASSKQDLLGQIRTYENFFPVFFHSFLRQCCAERHPEGERIFFDLPRYTWGEYVYFPVFSIETSWLNACLASPAAKGAASAKLITATASTATGDRKTLYESLIQVFCTFLKNESYIRNGVLQLDKFQIQRLHSSIAGNFFAAITENSNFYSYVNTIASLKYEKQECAASIALCSSQIEPPFIVKFAKPVMVEEHRKVRKLLAATGEKHCLVCRSGKLEGIVDIKEMAGWSGAAVYFLHFLRHLTWELLRDGAVLLRYEEGKLSMHRNEPSFPDILALISSQLEIPAPAAVSILTLIQTVRNSNHGSILVFSPVAAAEAVRLQHDCLQVEPFLLRPEDVSHFTVMDGALLLDTQCYCHALGVILDGETVPFSDSSRGSRFNSSLRYYGKHQHEKILVVVVSDDGMINLIPSPLLRGAENGGLQEGAGTKECAEFAPVAGAIAPFEVSNSFENASNLEAASKLENADRARRAATTQPERSR